MVRLIFAFAVCGAIFAAPAAAQNGNPETPAPQSAPAEPSATASVPAAALPPPGPYGETKAQSITPPEAPVAEPPSLIPHSPPAAEAPAPEVQKGPVAEAPPPAPQQAPVAETPPSAPVEKPVAEDKTPSLPIEGPPQTGATAEGKPENTESRFTFGRVDDGYVRLDNRTGQVSVCNKRAVGWTCQLVPEDRGVLEKEIARLQEENATLKKDMLNRGLPLPGAIKPEPPATQSSKTFRLPTDPDLDRMKVLLEQVWRRLVDMISSLQKDVMKKS